MISKRRCSKCRKLLPLTGFHRHKQGKDGYRSRCKACNRAEARTYYHRNPDAYIARAKRSNDKRYAERRALMRAIKERCGCQLCGESDIVTLDFHHVNPRQHARERSMAIGRAAKYSDVTFKRELKKCVVVCANCHRKVHAGRVEVPTGLSCYEEVI